MTKVTQNPEPFITHHSVDDLPLITFEEAIAVFQKYFPINNPVITKDTLVYENFSSLSNANAYRKLAHIIITQYSLPLVATAREHIKTRAIRPHVCSVEILSTTLIISYKP